MKRFAMAALAVALAAGAGRAQEEDRQAKAKAEAERLAKEAVESVTKAVNDAAGRGGVHLKGTVRFGPADGGMAVGFGAAGRKLEGEFTARIGKSGMLAAVIESEAGRLEVFRRGDKSVHRMTWAGGKPPNPGDVSRELGRILNWKVLSRFAPKLKDAKTETKDGAKLITARLPEEFLPEDDDEEGEDGVMVEHNFMILDRIEAIIHVGDDGSLKTLTVKVVRKLNPAIVMGAGGAGGGGDDDDDDDDDDDGGAPGGGPMDFKTESQYVVKIDRFEPEMDVEIPGDMKKFVE